MKKFNAVPFYNVKINNGFWRRRMDINSEVTVYSVMERFIGTGRFEAFKFNWKEGSDVPKPHFFWDSDVAKWIESAAYILSEKTDKKLYEACEELIELMDKNRLSDGYFNIYHTVAEPELKFQNRDHHELYCLGHFIEAAVAYYNATGRDKLLEIVEDYIDLVIRVFVKEKSAGFVTPGHEEIELALIKLYRLKNDRKFLDLAMFFIDERGKNEEYLVHWYNASYNQSHLPVRQQTEAFGHCVRACYLYSAMADAAKETGDKELLSACKSLFDDIVNKKMYITGGIGSTHKGEAFTVAYDLPSDSAYAETCASIALMMFSDRMKDIDFDSKYADIVEKEIYNGILAGVSLDGKAFFYENPLSLCLADRKRHTSVIGMDDRLPILKRKEVFDCSCCPPNITRFFASFGDHIFSKSSDSFVFHQYVSCKADIDGAVISVETDFPKSGKMTVTVKNGASKDFYVRIPGWADEFITETEFEAVNGYARFNIKSDSEIIDIEIPLSCRFMVSQADAKHISGKAAVMAGPVIYCAEGIDNDADIFSVRIDTKDTGILSYSEEYSCNTLTVNAFRKKSQKALYVPVEKIKEEKITLFLIPYFAFANRGESDMNVWFDY